MASVKEAWIGFVHGTFQPGNKYFPRGGAYVTAFAWAGGTEEYCRLVCRAAAGYGMKVTEIEDPEPFNTRILTDAVDKEFFRLAQKVWDTHSVQFHIFYSYREKKPSTRVEKKGAGARKLAEIIFTRKKFWGKGRNRPYSQTVRSVFRRVMVLDLEAMAFPGEFARYQRTYPFLDAKKELLRIWADIYKPGLFRYRPFAAEFSKNELRAIAKAAKRLRKLRRKDWEMVRKEAQKLLVFLERRKMKRPLLPH